MAGVNLALNQDPAYAAATAANEAARNAATLISTPSMQGYDLTTSVDNDQIGSQYWMDTDYTGPEPTLAVKAVLSTADYARDVAGQLARMYTNVYGDAVSPAIEQIAETYPVVTTQPAARTAQAAVAQVPVPVTTKDLYQAETPQDVLSADDLVTQGSDLLNTGVNWIENNLLLVIVAVCAVVILPRLAGSLGQTVSRRRG